MADRKIFTEKDILPSGVASWLLRAKANNGFRSPHFWIIAGFFAVLAYIYYFVLTSFQDVYIIVFLYPLVYAAIVFRMKGVAVSAVVLRYFLTDHLLQLFDVLRRP